MAHYAPFWRWIHGEHRVELPGAAEFMQVLSEMGIHPNLEIFAPEPFRGLKDWQMALTTLRQLMYTEPDTDADARLQKGMHELLVEPPDGFPMQGVGPGRLALISWRPG